MKNTVEIDLASIARFLLGLVLSGIGLYVAFWRSLLPDGHYDHTTLQYGIGVAGFGALIWAHPYMMELLALAKAYVTRTPMRFSGSVPTQPDEPDDSQRKG